MARAHPFGGFPRRLSQCLVLVLDGPGAAFQRSHSGAPLSLVSRKAFIMMVVALLVAAVPPGAARADEFLCGRPATRGVGPTASDALFTLTAATGGIPCKLCVCDVDQSGSVRASDALLILRWAVGAASDGACPAPCESECLDGIVDPDEECDDGLETKSCDSNCTLARCGDGTSNAARGEECDTHGRSAACDGDCTLAICGDGNLNSSASELCDDGNTVDGDACSADCSSGTSQEREGCGNGKQPYRNGIGASHGLERGTPALSAAREHPSSGPFARPRTSFLEILGSAGVSENHASRTGAMTRAGASSSRRIGS